MLDGQPRYDSYKESGVPWLGGVPMHWEIKPLAGLFAVSREKNGKNIVGSMLSVSGYRGIEEKKYESEGQIREDKDLADYRVVRPSQLVVNTMWLNHTGLGVSEIEGHVSPAYRAYNIHPSLIPRYAHHLLRCHSYVQGYTGLMQGIRPNSLQIKDVDFKRMPVLVPDLDTQNRIVRFLDEKTAEIDAAIAKKRRLIELLNEQKAILINRAVTKGLNPDAPMKDSGVDWIGEIPAHWKIVPLMAVAEVIDPNPSHRNPEYVDEGFPFISTQEFIGWDDIEIDTPRRVSEKTVLEQERRCGFRRGSIVFSRKGTIGATRVLPFGVRLGILDSLCVINPKQGVTPEFLVGTLGADYLAAQYGPTVKGAALPQLSVGKVRSLRVILPPDEEQYSIQAELASIKAEHHRLDEVVQSEISTLNEFKQTLIANAVTGKIKI
ncbi:restriction endonuclease subunit S [Octadecabacter sp. SW4]|uniref:restriction endonuclease subunit S n=1 Tax=Octadecabacter sp. SW4 TaxID=2602067 RepID=UPI0011C1D95B|nr:restriction endonuclease subunit S [Octadecabacter sp. SW4]QEE34997.1 restriction endonuclease subunit S [Octadecabacter sp. SW4]